jgi:hypothetical protein
VQRTLRGLVVTPLQWWGGVVCLSVGAGSDNRGVVPGDPGAGGWRRVQGPSYFKTVELIREWAGMVR